MAEKPKGPTDLHAGGWKSALGRAVSRHRGESRMDTAAALTYYGLLALFPALLALVALLGVVGEHPRTTNAMLDIIEGVGSQSAVDTFRGPIENVVQSSGGAGALLGVGFLGALWSASGYIGAFTRANNAIWEVGEGRPFWKLKPIQIGITILMLVLMAATGLIIVATGPLASEIAGKIGLGDAGLLAWEIAKWPVLLLMLVLVIAVLYNATPNVRQPRFRWISVGAGLALVVAIVASALFALYVASFGNYNATYGSFGAVIILLLWMWLINNALLLGSEVDAELERERELVAGDRRAEESLQLPERESARSD